MPLDYSRGFGQIGAGAGAAGGAGFLGSLGRLLEPLDYPRQALWNLPGKLAEGDWSAALPGIMGLGGTAMLAATGAGLPLAILGGSLVGGGLQGGFRNADSPEIDNSRYEAPTPSDLVKALGMDPESGLGTAAGFGLGVLGDPLTYAGGLGGGKLGGKYGSQYGKYAGLRGEALGPQYEGGVQKLLGNVPGRSASEASDIALRQLALEASPQAERLASFLPPDIQMTAHGAEG